MQRINHFARFICLCYFIDIWIFYFRDHKQTRNNAKYHIEKNTEQVKIKRSSFESYVQKKV